MGFGVLVHDVDIVECCYGHVFSFTITGADILHLSVGMGIENRFLFRTGSQ